MHTQTQSTASTPRGFIFVDNSNLFIGAQALAAVRQGLARDIPDAIQHSRRGNYRIDFSRIYEFFAGPERHFKKALLAGSVAANQTPAFKKPAERAGFRTKIFERVNNVEKGVDSTAVEIVVDALTLGDPLYDDVTILSGDLDLLPFVQQLRQKNYHVDVASWDHCASASMKSAASRFISLDEFYEHFKFQP